MAIRPVDMALPVQRSTEMTRAQTGEQRPELQQSQFAARMIRETQLKEQQVQQSPKSEESQIHRDGKGNSGGYARRDGKKKGSKAQEEKPVKEKDKSKFDFSI